MASCDPFRKRKLIAAVSVTAFLGDDDDDEINGIVRTNNSLNNYTATVTFIAHNKLGRVH